MRPQRFTFEILWYAELGGYWLLRIVASEYGDSESVDTVVSPQDLENKSVFGLIFDEAKRKLLDRIGEG